MVKRLISANASDVLKMTAAELKQSIRASEGRVVLTEVVPVSPAFIGDITQAEIASAFGSDMILLNGVDIIEPKIYGLKDSSHFVEELHRLVGRPIGINLEPVDPEANMAEEKRYVAEGRQVSEKTAKLLEDHHLDFVCITGNPGTGVTNELIKSSVAVIKSHFSGLVIAGKMHGAGVSEPVADRATLEALIDAGVDILLVPAVGTVPGFTEEDLRQAVRYAHERGALVMTAIGTSQEGADVETIRQIALMNKIAGVDIQHIGDAGYHGMALVDNIFALSNTVRGIRHTISRIARSVNR